MNDRNDTPKTRAFTRLVLEIFHLHGLLLATGDKLTAELGLSSALWQVLGAVDHGPLPMAQIARNMGLTRQSVRRTAYILEQKGLVSFQENPDHRRAMLVQLTQLGRETLNEVNRIWAAWANATTQDTPLEAINNAEKTLQKLAARLTASADGDCS